MFPEAPTTEVIVDTFEELTPQHCDEGQFRCGGDSAAPADVAECIPAEWRCDGRVDCTDGSDEALHCGQQPLSALSTSRLNSIK